MQTIALYVGGILLEVINLVISNIRAIGRIYELFEGLGGQF
jgi:hypothetical protein